MGHGVRRRDEDPPIPERGRYRCEGRRSCPGEPLADRQLSRPEWEPDGPVVNLDSCAEPRELSGLEPRCLPAGLRLSDLQLGCGGRTQSYRQPQSTRLYNDGGKQGPQDPHPVGQCQLVSHGGDLGRVCTRSPGREQHLASGLPGPPEFLRIRHDLRVS